MLQSWRSWERGVVCIILSSQRWIWFPFPIHHDKWVWMSEVATLKSLHIEDPLTFEMGSSKDVNLEVPLRYVLRRTSFHHSIFPEMNLQTNNGPKAWFKLARFLITRPPQSVGAHTITKWNFLVFYAFCTCHKKVLIYLLMACNTFIGSHKPMIERKYERANLIRTNLPWGLLVSHIFLDIL